MSGQVKIWEKQEWEDDLLFRVFNIWLKMEDRDLDEAWRQHSGEQYTATGQVVKAPSYVIKASRGISAVQLKNGSEITWDDRARAYDIEQQRKDIFLWNQRRNKIRKEEFGMAEMLIKRAKEMLEWPIYQDDEVTKDDKTTIIRKPAKWGLRDVSGMAKIASELFRLSAEMNTAQISLHISFSPEAMEAVDTLKKFGIDYNDVVKQFEGLLIDAAKRYQDQDSR